MAYMYCRDCGEAIGEFFSLIELIGKKGDEIVDKAKENHQCKEPGRFEREGKERSYGCSSNEAS
jgi:hypothetical protein